MSEKNFIEELESAQIDYLAALSRGSGTAGARDRLKNYLFTYCGEIMEALRRTAELEAEVAGLRDDIASLEAALAEADEETARLKASAVPTPKKASRAKAKEDVDGGR